MTDAPTSSAITWATCSDDADARARASHRPLLVFTRADWDGTSAELERHVFTDPEVAREVRSYLATKLDVTDDDSPAGGRRTAWLGSTQEPEITLIDDGRRERIRGLVSPGELAQRLRAFAHH